MSLSNGTINYLFGKDYLPPIGLANTSISLEVLFNPMMIQSSNIENRTLEFRLLDMENNSSLNVDSYFISIFKNELVNNTIIKTILINNTFFSDKNFLILKFDNSNQTENFGFQNLFQNQNPIVAKSGIVNISDMVLDSGIYDLKVSVYRSENDIKENERELRFYSSLSLGNVLPLKINDGANTNYNITILSYNNKILNPFLIFNKDSKVLSYEVPFHYNITRIEEGFINIHTEIKFPKTLEQIFNLSNYSSTINGKQFDEISKSSFLIDKFSADDEITIHFILDSNSLFKLAKDFHSYNVLDKNMTILFSFFPTN
ncbi:MAG: hypothetical protein ACPKPY_01945 [Nitrososphaeraceae archaeon]